MGLFESYISHICTNIYITHILSKSRPCFSHLNLGKIWKSKSIYDNKLGLSWARLRLTHWHLELKEVPSNRNIWPITHWGGTSRQGEKLWDMKIVLPFWLEKFKPFKRSCKNTYYVENVEKVQKGERDQRWKSKSPQFKI